MSRLALLITYDSTTMIYNQNQPRDHEDQQRGIQIQKNGHASQRRGQTQRREHKLHYRETQAQQRESENQHLGLTNAFSTATPNVAKVSPMIKLEPGTEPEDLFGDTGLQLQQPDRQHQQHESKNQQRGRTNASPAALIASSHDTPQVKLEPGTEYVNTIGNTTSQPCRLESRPQRQYHIPSAPVNQAATHPLPARPSAPASAPFQFQYGNVHVYIYGGKYEPGGVFGPNDLYGANPVYGRNGLYGSNGVYGSNDPYGGDGCNFVDDGHQEDGYDEDGFDEDGYDEDGYDEDGYDEDGYDEDGIDEYGNHCRY